MFYLQYWSETHVYWHKQWFDNVCHTKRNTVVSILTDITPLLHFAHVHILQSLIFETKCCIYGMVWILKVVVYIVIVSFLYGYIHTAFDINSSFKRLYLCRWFRIVHDTLFLYYSAYIKNHTDPLRSMYYQRAVEATEGNKQYTFTYAISLNKRKYFSH